MAVETLNNPRSNLPNVYTNVTAREVELAARFETNWDALRAIMGIMRPIRKRPGTALYRRTASVELADPKAVPGAVTEFSQVTFTQTGFQMIQLEEYAAATTLQEIADYSAEIALDRRDAAFIAALQNKVLTDYYTFLNAAVGLTGTATTWQAALAKAKGMVVDKFNKLRKTVTEVVGFANVLDAYEYVGEAQITVQTSFGVSYVENFLGYRTLFLLSEPDIAPGKVIAVPVENIDMNYIDPSDADFAEGGLNYTTAGGETNLVGFHVQGAHRTGTSEIYALMGIKLWSEIEDGIAIVDIE